MDICGEVEVHCDRITIRQTAILRVVVHNLSFNLETD